MPLYEYACLGCGEVVEHYRQISERGWAPEHCEGAEVERIISAPAVAGWRGSVGFDEHALSSQTSAGDVGMDDF